MGMPFTPNITFDLYRSGNAPPTAPDAAAVSGLLAPKGQSTLTTEAYTHLLRVDAAQDIRDDNANGDFVNNGPNADSLFVPDKNGTKFVVILVRRLGRGTAADHKEVLLKRTVVNWPSNDV